jgi:hypothetical protein
VLHGVEVVLSRCRAVEQPVSYHQREKQRGPKMGEECEEQQVSKNRVQLPAPRRFTRSLVLNQLRVLDQNACAEKIR